MHPTIGYQIANAQIDAHRRQANRDRAARATKRTRRNAQPDRSHPAPRWNPGALTRHVLTILGAHSG